MADLSHNIAITTTDCIQYRIGVQAVYCLCRYLFWKVSAGFPSKMMRKYIPGITRLRIYSKIKPGLAIPAG